MTKDRARKQAARERAALTGERYVVAQRAVAEPELKRIGRLDRLTHRVPGVPAHVEGGLQASAPRNHNSKHEVRPHTQPTEPRVFVVWQNWIARQLGARSR